MTKPSQHIFTFGGFVSAMVGSIAIGLTGLGGTLAVIFMVLKLCHVISWTWWLVFAPAYVPLAVALVVAIVIFGLAACLAIGGM